MHTVLPLTAGRATASIAYLATLALAVTLARLPGLARAAEPLPTVATPAATVPSRMLYELPVTPPAAARASGLGEATRASTPSPADPATVARELGQTGEASTDSLAPEPALPSGALEPRDGWAEFRRKYGIHGMLSVGVGSHGTYQASIGVSTAVGPSTTVSAGVAVGRWTDGLGWWYPDPWLDSRGSFSPAP